MKKIITPLGSLIALISAALTWLYLGSMGTSYGRSQKLAVSLYEMYRASAALGFIRLGVVLIALILLIAPFFLKNPLRKIFVAGLSVGGILLVLAFVNLKGDLSWMSGFVELGIGWFAAFFGFLIAFTGAFIKTSETEKSSMPALAVVIVSLCLLTSLTAFVFLSPPFGAFPLSVDGAPRTSPVIYRKDENYPGVYMATFGADILYSLQKKDSADEAKDYVKKTRDSIKQQAERAFDRWKNENKYESEIGAAEIEESYRKELNAVFLAPEDKPENDYLVYVSGSNAHVIWANGNRLYAVTAPKPVAAYSEDLPAAKDVFDFARSLPYPPANTTAPENKNREFFSLYGFYHDYFPLWFSENALTILPLIIAAPFVLLLVLGIFRRKTN